MHGDYSIPFLSEKKNFLEDFNKKENGTLMPVKNGEKFAAFVAFDRKSSGDLEVEPIFVPLLPSDFGEKVKVLEKLVKDGYMEKKEAQKILIDAVINMVKLW